MPDADVIPIGGRGEPGRGSVRLHRLLRAPCPLRVRRRPAPSCQEGCQGDADRRGRADLEGGCLKDRTR